MIRCAVFLLLLVTAIGVGGYYGFTQLGTPPQPSTSVPDLATVPIANPPKTYTLNARVTPEGGGQVQISAPNGNEAGPQITKAYEPGTQITLTAIPNEGWKFKRWDGYTSDLNYIDITIKEPMTITAQFADTAPPKILDFGVFKVTEVCASITWKTAEPITTYEIKYGKNPDCELSGPSREQQVTDHSVRLQGLEPNTTYYCMVSLTDASKIPASSETRTFTTLSPLPAEVGNRAPDFALPRLGDNAIVVLSDFRGKKVLLNLWATRCTGCVLELPYIQEIYVKYPDLAVITVCLNKNIESISNFVEEHPELTFPILVNQPSITKGGYTIRVMPTTFFIDADGIIKKIQVESFKSSEDIEHILLSLNFISSPAQTR